MSMDFINQERKKLREELIEKCRRAAEERGREFRIITKVVPFLNDDVPKYLTSLEECEKRAREISIMVGGYREKVA